MLHSDVGAIERTRNAETQCVGSLGMGASNVASACDDTTIKNLLVRINFPRLCFPSNKNFEKILPLLISSLKFVVQKSNMCSYFIFCACVLKYKKVVIDTCMVFCPHLIPSVF